MMVNHSKIITRGCIWALINFVLNTIKLQVSYSLIYNNHFTKGLTHKVLKA